MEINFEFENNYKDKNFRFYIEFWGRGVANTILVYLKKIDMVHRFGGGLIEKINHDLYGELTKTRMFFGYSGHLYAKIDDLQKNQEACEKCIKELILNKDLYQKEMSDKEKFGVDRGDIAVLNLARFNYEVCEEIKEILYRL